MKRKEVIRFKKQKYWDVDPIQVFGKKIYIYLTLVS